ncbi:hypothetical protein ACOMHN_038698 [Nucella lapillus]
MDNTSVLMTDTFSKADWPALCSSARRLSDSIISPRSQLGDDEAIWSSLKGLTAIVQQHAPLTTTRMKTNNPWVKCTTTIISQTAAVQHRAACWVVSRHGQTSSVADICNS